MSRLVLILFASAATGCSLVIDTDAVRARRDGGLAADAASHDDAGRDAAGHDDATGADDAAVTRDAATDADGGTAEDAAAPDASPCARAGAGLLSCRPPITVVSGRDLAFPSIAARTGGYVTTIAEERTVVTRLHDMTGAVTATYRSPSSIRPTGLQVAAHGEHWAVAYAPGTGRTLRCASSADTRTASITTGQPVNDVAVAVGPTGIVALGGVEGYFVSTSLSRAVSTQPGCPTAAAEMQPAYYTRGVAAMHVPGGSADEFRFAVSAVHPNLEDSVLAEVNATGSQFNWLVYGGLGVRGVEIAPASAGVHMALGYVWHDETTGAYQLWGGLHRVDFGGPPATERELSADITDFDFAACDADTLVSAYLVDEGRGRLSTKFLGADIALSVLGTPDEQDVTCMLPAMGAELDIACAGGELAVFYTQGSRAELYRCDVPTLR